MLVAVAVAVAVADKLWLYALLTKNWAQMVKPSAPFFISALNHFLTDQDCPHYHCPMNIWRPSQNIRVIAIGLNWRGDRLLAVEVLNDEAKLKGVRPLGGGVEFGETW
jgi:hypothetical protein